MSRFIPDDKIALLQPADLLGGMWNPGNRPPAEVAAKVTNIFDAGVDFLCMAEMLDQAAAKQRIAATGLEVRSGPNLAQQRLAVVTNPSRLKMGEPIAVLGNDRGPTIWKRGRDMAEAKWLLGATYTDTVTGRSPDIVASHALHQQWNPLRARLVRQHVSAGETWMLSGGGTKILAWDANMLPGHHRMEPLNTVATNSQLSLGVIPTFGPRAIDMVSMRSRTQVFVTHWTVGMGKVGPKKNRIDHRLYLTAIRATKVDTTPCPVPVTIEVPCILPAGHPNGHLPAPEGARR